MDSNPIQAGFVAQDHTSTYQFLQVKPTPLTLTRNAARRFRRYTGPSPLTRDVPPALAFIAFSVQHCCPMGAQKGGSQIFAAARPLVASAQKPDPAKVGGGYPTANTLLIERCGRELGHRQHMVGWFWSALSPIPSGRAARGGAGAGGQQGFASQPISET